LVARAKEAILDLRKIKNSPFRVSARLGYVKNVYFFSGDFGYDGRPGLKGMQGARGYKGERGPAAEWAEPGDQGNNGADGLSGRSGTIK
jgi:hypothetical protein